MNPIHPNLAQKPLNWHQGTSLMTFAIGIIIFSAAAYWFDTLSLTVSYSLLVLGTSFIVGGLIHFAIQSCQKKALPSTPIHISENPSKDSSVETVDKPAERNSVEEIIATQVVSNIHEKPAEERPEIELLKNLHYHPDTLILKDYSYSFKTEKDGIEFLKKYGQKAGDYILLPPTSSDVLHFAWIDQDLNVKKIEIHNPTTWFGELYNIVYDDIRYPLLPPRSKLNRSVIHHSLIGYKYRSLLKDLDFVKGAASYPTIGLLQDFVLWLKDSDGKHRFDPHIFFKIVGHVFGLSGTYTYLFRGANMGIETECTVDYEGFDRYLGRSILMRDFSDYLSKSLLPPEYRQKIKIMCKNAYTASHSYDKNNPSLSDLIKLLKGKYPITILTGWEGHAVNLTMTEKELIYTNKGNRAGKSPGMHRFKIGKLITEDLLKKIVALKKPEDFPLDPKGESTLKSLLNLEYISSYPAFYHKSGCCVFANNRLCYKAAAILLKAPDWAAHQDFKAALDASREFWLEAIFTIIENAPDDKNLKTELYFFLCLLKAKIELRSSIMKNTKKTDQVLLEKMAQKAKKWSKNDNHEYLQLIAADNLLGFSSDHYQETHWNFILAFVQKFEEYYNLKKIWVKVNNYKET